MFLVVKYVFNRLIYGLRLLVNKSNKNDFTFLSNYKTFLQTSVQNI